MLHHLNPVPLAPTRVAIVGANGFIGRAVAQRLDEARVPVLCMGRREVDLLAPDAADRLAARLRDGDALVATAAIAPCKNAEMLRDNMTLALTIVRAAEKVKLAQVVNISSDAVYADLPVPLTEASATAPDTLHGVMHLAREVMFRAEVKVPLASLRPTLVYGAGDTHNGYGPNRFRRLAVKREPIKLFGEGEERRDHVLIDDVAELVRRVLFCRSTGTINVATGTVTSFRDVAEMVVRLSGYPVAIRGSKRVGPMPHNGYRAFDIAACREAFPDFVYTPLAQGLAEAQRNAAKGGTAP